MSTKKLDYDDGILESEAVSFLKEWAIYEKTRPLQPGPIEKANFDIWPC